MTNDNRETDDWINAFMENTKWGEAPPHFYFWVAVATIAATLRRRVWLDMGTFLWYPNLYTLFVAPPGIVQKSSTTDLGVRLIKRIPGIFQGPTTLTWQALYDAFIEVGTEFEIPGENRTCTEQALYIHSSEFGTTLNMQDTDMIDQLVHCWDGYELKKRTRGDGEQIIPTPSLNIMACTTPSWIAQNVPEYIIGGGLTSRMLMVYGETKARYVAYPKRHMPADYPQRQERLVRDLERISKLAGNFTLTDDAYEWGEMWYENFHKVEAPKLDKALVGGYIARKQTLVHKVAMVLAVSRGDALILTRTLLEEAAAHLTSLEEFMPKVYSRVGLTIDGKAGQDVIEFLARYGGTVKFEILYRHMLGKYPDPALFENILIGLKTAGLINVNQGERTISLRKAPE
jgi:hypothetical protein